MQKYEALDTIGKGSFGILAWKEIDYRKMSTNEKKQLVSEVNILKDLRHQNIVRYYERIVDKENCMIYIVMEYCDGGDLSKLIQNCKGDSRLIPEEFVWDVFYQLVEALYECHHGQIQKRGVIIHRDIKPENVFISGDMVKLGDFGLSRVIENPGTDFAKTYAGSPYYMSPEIVSELNYNQKSDVWSLGCLLYELCTLRPPFEARSQTELNRKIKIGQVNSIPSFYSQELNDYIQQLLTINIDERPCALTIRDLPRIQLQKKSHELRIRMQQVANKEKHLIRLENELQLKCDQLQLMEQEMNLSFKRKLLELDAREQSLKERELSIQGSEAAVKLQQDGVLSISTSDQGNSKSRLANLSQRRSLPNYPNFNKSKEIQNEDIYSFKENYMEQSSIGIQSYRQYKGSYFSSPQNKSSQIHNSPYINRINRSSNNFESYRDYGSIQDSPLKTPISQEKSKFVWDSPNSDIDSISSKISQIRVSSLNKNKNEF